MTKSLTKEWMPTHPCMFHETTSCDCGPEMRSSRWALLDEHFVEVGVVVQFHEGASYYGVTAHGRTGAMNDLYKCQAIVELDVATKGERFKRK